MNDKVNKEVAAILRSVKKAQSDSASKTGKCFKISNEKTGLEGLTYTCLNYWNERQKAGYGVIFTYVEDGKTYEMSRDIGFLDADYIILGDHPVLNFDWREKVITK